jgi:hydrogenase maturation factor HypE
VTHYFASPYEQRAPWSDVTDFAITAHERLSVIFCDNRVINQVNNRVMSYLSQITLPPLGRYSDNLVIAKNNRYVDNNGCVTRLSLVSSVNIHLLV